ncbi:MAG TPA: DedA family protein [Longimicrobiaceae bacterium]|nr:DedA family protein [Longimicrobiaceae bacterium]
MDATWIEKYGLLAVFVGGILEGETTFVVAGFAASRGYLDPFAAYLVAVAGAMTGDCGYFLLGRYHGQRLVRAFPSLRKLRARAVLLLRRWGRTTAFLARFAYGLRVVLPLSMGAARMRPGLFIAFDLLGSLCFAALYLGLGYLFGETVEEMLLLVRPYEKWILAGLLLTGAAVWTAREWKLFHPKPGEELPAPVVERMQEEVEEELRGEKK